MRGNLSKGRKGREEEEVGGGGTRELGGRRGDQRRGKGKEGKNEGKRGGHELGDDGTRGEGGERETSKGEEEGGRWVERCE